MKTMFAKLKNVPLLSHVLCFSSLVFLDYAFRFFYQFVGITPLLNLKTAAFTFGWCAIFTALFSLLPQLARRIAMLLSIGIFSLLAFTHSVMFNIFGEFFTFADLNFAGDGAKFFSWTYLRLRLALLACILLAILIMVLAAWLAPKKKGNWKTRVAALAVIAVCIVPMVMAHNRLIPVEEEEMWWGSTFDPNAALYKDFTDSNRCLLLTGLYHYTFRDLLTSTGLRSDVRSTQELDAYFAEREVSGANEMTSAFAGKNLIMVMLESIDTWLITPEYMPNLYALQEKSVNFTAFYTPLYLSAGTFCTEIISQTGQIPAVSGLSNSAYSANAFPNSLANLFKAQGYRANAFHSADPMIYSRGSVHANLGFEKYHSYVDMQMDDYMLDSQLINGYDLMVSEAPYFTYIITYSGHGPYTEEIGNIAAGHYAQAQAAVAVSGVTSNSANMEEYTRAVAHAMETDRFIGELYASLVADGHIEDTVLLFYADHYGKYMSDKDFLAALKGVSDNAYDLYRTPCFFYSEDYRAQEVGKISGSIDLVPTIVNLFGLETDPRYYAGDDIFGEYGGYVILPNYAWYDGTVYYESGFAGEMTQEISERCAQVRRRMNASTDVLKSNYFSTLQQ
ncbi:MAG: sulfatase-like hydrolase/transferase [Oscillospiraceae bacterium]|jgi:phosphoglycerol transferase MdoB-like AlkP superfamily enzyme|nr:sulfatase-like hydrolase/transferase [Oscillospiraceae bacterium]